MPNILDQKQFVKRLWIEVHSEVHELVSSDEPKMKLRFRFTPSSAALLALTFESKVSDLMSEAQFDELVARLKTQYFSKEYETIEY